MYETLPEFDRKHDKNLAVNMTRILQETRQKCCRKHDQNPAGNTTKMLQET
jgi:hypothetical protein